MLQITTNGIKKLVPDSSKRLKRPPVTLAHMHALAANLDPNDSRDVATLAAASACFWGVCRLGELTPPSPAAFDPALHVTNCVALRAGQTAGGVKHLHFRIPKTKTSSSGADIHLVAIADPSCPIAPLVNHLEVNASVPRGSPLFAFASPQGHTVLTKTLLLARCNEVWTASGLPPLPGHAFRIGGATELLLRGTPPDIVMVLGRWKSKAFIEYWRRIDEILPLFLSNSFSEPQITQLQSAMSVTRRHCARP